MVKKVGPYRPEIRQEIIRIAKQAFRNVRETCTAQGHALGPFIRQHASKTLAPHWESACTGPCGASVTVYVHPWEDGAAWSCHISEAMQCLCRADIAPYGHLRHG